MSSGPEGNDEKVVVDEVGMLDVLLANQVVKAVARTCSWRVTLTSRPPSAAR